MAGRNLHKQKMLCVYTRALDVECSSVAGCKSFWATFTAFHLLNGFVLVCAEISGRVLLSIGG